MKRNPKAPMTKPAHATKPAPQPPRPQKIDRIALAKRMVEFRKRLKLDHAGAAAMAQISLESWECCEGATSPTRRATVAKVVECLDRWKDRRP